MINVKVCEGDAALRNNYFFWRGLYRPADLLEHSGPISVALREVWFAAHASSNGAASERISVLWRRIVVKILCARQNFCWSEILYEHRRSSAASAGETSHDATSTQPSDMPIVTSGVS